MDNAELIEWCQSQLADAERDLAAREQAEQRWRSGTTASWREAGCRLTKPQRLRTADREARIAVLCRHNVEMIKAVIAALSK